MWNNGAAYGGQVLAMQEVEKPIIRRGDQAIVVEVGVTDIAIPVTIGIALGMPPALGAKGPLGT